MEALQPLKQLIHFASFTSLRFRPSPSFFIVRCCSSSSTVELTGRAGGGGGNNRNRRSSSGNSTSTSDKEAIRAGSFAILRLEHVQWTASVFAFR